MLRLFRRYDYIHLFKVSIVDLDTIIHNLPRLHIMSILAKGQNISFQEVMTQLNMTSGNLFSHCAVLEKAGYIEKIRDLSVSGRSVKFRITPLGTEHFTSYLQTMQKFLDIAEMNLEWNNDEFRNGLPPSIFVTSMDREGNKFNLALFE